MHSSVKAITVEAEQDIAAVLAGNWPQLSLIKMQPTAQAVSHRVRRLQGDNNSLQVVALLHATPLRQEPPLYGLRQQQHLTAFLVTPAAQQHQLTQHMAAAFSNLQKSGWQQADRLTVHVKNSEGNQVIAQVVMFDWSDVTSLNLADSTLGSAAVEQLAKGAWSKLKQLNLGRNQLDKAAMTALCSRKWPSLAELKLDSNSSIGAAALSVLAQAPSWDLLTSLSLAHVHLDIACASSLVPMHSHVRTLDLSFTSLDTAVLSELFSVSWPQLECLILEGNGLQADAIAALVLVSLPSLEILDLSANRLDAAAARHLATGAWPELRQLTLVDNCLDNAAMVLLAKAQWPALYSMTLDNNDISDLGLEKNLNG